MANPKLNVEWIVRMVVILSPPIGKLDAAIHTRRSNDDPCRAYIRYGWQRPRHTKQHQGQTHRIELAEDDWCGMTENGEPWHFIVSH